MSTIDNIPKKIKFPLASQLRTSQPGPGIIVYQGERIIVAIDNYRSKSLITFYNSDYVALQQRRNVNDNGHLILMVSIKMKIVHQALQRNCEGESRIFVNASEGYRLHIVASSGGNVSEFTFINTRTNRYYNLHIF